MLNSIKLLHDKYFMICIYKYLPIPYLQTCKIASKYWLLQIREHSLSLLSQYMHISMSFSKMYMWYKIWKILPNASSKKLLLFSHISPQNLLYLCFIFARSQGWEIASTDLYFIEFDHLFLSFLAICSSSSANLQFAPFASLLFVVCISY